MYVHIRRLKLPTYMLANFWAIYIRTVTQTRNNASFLLYTYMHIHTVFEKMFILYAIRAHPSLIILQETAMVGTSCKIFLQTQNRLEMALLTFLRNTNLHNVKIALTCFRFLVQLTEVLMITGEPCPVPFADNIKPYQALYDASSNLLIGEWVLIVFHMHCGKILIDVYFQNSKFCHRSFFNPFQYMTEQSVIW